MRKLYQALLALCCLAFLSGSAAWASPPVASESFEATYHKIWHHVGQRYQCGSIAGWSSFEHKYDGKLSSVELLRVAVNDMLSAAGDARLRLLTADEADRFQARHAGGYVGVGISFEPRFFVKKHVTIKEVLADSPAEDAGLKAGDIIVAVNDAPLAGTAVGEVSSLLQGVSGSTAKLSLIRAGQSIEISVKRDLDGTLGVAISADDATKLFLVTYVMHGSPAQKSEIQEGDLILAIDGYVPDQLEYAEAGAKLRGRLGTEAVLKLRRGDVELEQKVVRGVVPNFGLFIGFGTQNYLEFDYAGRSRGRTQVDLKSLDWNEVAAWLDDHVGGMNQHDAAILDLRGCEGSPEAAARFAARFMIESGEVLRYSQRHGDDSAEVIYVIENRVLRRVTRLTVGKLTTITQDDVEKLPQRYEQRLVVLIDGKTQGAAESLARALQRSQRACLIGSATAGQSVVSTTEQFGSGSQALFVQMPCLTLQDENGDSLGSVSPDRRVWFGSAETSAKKEISGIYWYNDLDVIVTAVMVAAGLLILGCFLVVRFFARLPKMPVREESAPGSPVPEGIATNEPATSDPITDAAGGGTSDQPARADEAVADNEATAVAPVPVRPPSQSRRSSAGTVAGVLVLVALLAVLAYFGYRSGKAPFGARAEVIVEFYTDGSPQCADQAAVIARLKSEYDGPIEFRTIDIGQQPFLTPEVAGEQTEKVERVPMIRVRYHWLDKDGKHLSRGPSWGGARTKRDLVADIERAQTNLNYQHPWSEKIIRHRGR